METTNEKPINKRDVDMFVKKSAAAYQKTEEETLQSPIVQEVIKSYTKGGCNYKEEVKQ